MIDCVCWRWGGLFSRDYVIRLRNMLGRQLHLPWRLTCVTDDLTPVAGVKLLPMPTAYRDTIRCRRRMQQYSAAFAGAIGRRLLSLDLDMVLVDDITPLANGTEPIGMWRVGYANVLSGSLVLWDAAALDGAWQCYRADPEGYPLACGGPNASDQAMLNHWLAASRTPVVEWRDADGITPWFGAGYEHLEHHGMGPGRPALKAGTRIVVLGSADKAALDEGRYDWVRTHWR